MASFLHRSMAMRIEGLNNANEVFFGFCFVSANQKILLLAPEALT